MKKKISVILIALLLLQLCACASGQEKESQIPAGSLTESRQGETEEVLKKEKLYPLGYNCTVKGMARIENSILFWGSDEGTPVLGLAEYSLAEDGSIALSETKPLSLPHPEASDEVFIYDATAGGDKAFYILAGELPALYFSKGELCTNEDWEGNMCILRYSQNGDFEEKLVLSEWYMDSGIGFGVLNQNSIAIFDNSNIAFLDWGEGIILTETMEEGCIPVTAQLWNDKLVLSVEDWRNAGENSRFLLYDRKSGELTDLPLPKTEAGESLDSWTSCQGLNGEYVLLSNGVFYTADFTTGNAQELMRWRYKNTDMNHAYALRLGEKTFLCQEQGSDAVIAVYMTERPAVERSLVKVALYNVSNSAADFIFELDNQSDAYHYEIAQYGEDELNRLLTVLGTAEAPDLLIFNKDVNTASNYFEDLYPYLDADPELSRESFLPGLLETLSVNGELHELWDAVAVNTFAARSADVGDGQGLSPEDYDRIVEENPQYQAVFQNFMSKENLLKIISVVGISKYVDRASGTCNFEDPGFAGLLAWCARMGEEIPEGSDYPYLEADEVVLSYEVISSFDRISAIRTNYFEAPYVFTGFPTGDDNGSFYSPYGYSYAIPRSAANKEGAWACIQSQFACEAQKEREYGLPVNYEAFLAKAEKTLEEDAALLTGLLEHTGFAENTADEPLRQLVVECGMAYLAGDKSLEETLSVIQGRASIYLSERYG